MASVNPDAISSVVTIPPTLPVVPNATFIGTSSTSSSSIPSSTTPHHHTLVHATKEKPNEHSLSSSTEVIHNQQHKKAAVGTVNVQRRTWDREEYERKAKERLEREQYELLHGTSISTEKTNSSSTSTTITTTNNNNDNTTLPEFFRTADPTMKGPERSERAFLVARENDLQLDTQLNKRKVSK